MSGIICDHCKLPIGSRDDLVVSPKFIFYKLRKHHRKCYQDQLGKAEEMGGLKLKSKKMEKKIINSRKNTFSVVLGLVFLWAIALFILARAEGFLFIPAAIIFFLFPLPDLLIRLYSYFKFERAISS